MRIYQQTTSPFSPTDESIFIHRTLFMHLLRKMIQGDRIATDAAAAVINQRLGISHLLRHFKAVGRKSKLDLVLVFK